MVNNSSKKAFERIAKASSALSASYERDPAWMASPFGWIQGISSASRGKVGREFVCEWARQSGFMLDRVNENGQLYLLVEGWRVQVKTSLLWKNGSYRFQQIRDQEYDFCFCLGISPDDIHAWLVPKDVLEVHVINQTGQHTGARAQETFWFDAAPGNLAGWLQPYGNQLADATSSFKKYLGGL